MEKIKGQMQEISTIQELIEKPDPRPKNKDHIQKIIRITSRQKQKIKVKNFGNLLELCKPECFKNGNRSSVNLHTNQANSKSNVNLTTTKSSSTGLCENCTMLKYRGPVIKFPLDCSEAVGDNNQINNSNHNNNNNNITNGPCEPLNVFDYLLCKLKTWCYSCTSTSSSSLSPSSRTSFCIILLGLHIILLYYLLWTNLFSNSENSPISHTSRHNKKDNNFYDHNFKQRPQFKSNIIYGEPNNFGHTSTIPTFTEKNEGSSGSSSDENNEKVEERTLHENLPFPGRNDEEQQTEGQGYIPHTYHNPDYGKKTNLQDNNNNNNIDNENSRNTKGNDYDPLNQRNWDEIQSEPDVLRGAMKKCTDRFY